MAQKADSNMAKMANRSAKCAVGGLGRKPANLGPLVEKLSSIIRNMKREAVCHLAAASFSLLIVTPVFFMVIDRRDPVILQQEGSRIVPGAMYAGDPFSVVYQVIERKACDGEILVRIIDSTGRVFAYAVEPTVYRRTLDRETNTFVKNRIAPLGMSPGPATYTVEPYRWCNWFQKYVWPVRSQGMILSFTVLERPELRPRQE